MITYTRGCTKFPGLRGAVRPDQIRHVTETVYSSRGENDEPEEESVVELILYTGEKLLVADPDRNEFDRITNALELHL